MVDGDELLLRMGKTKGGFGSGSSVPISCAEHGEYSFTPGASSP